MADLEQKSATELATELKKKISQPETFLIYLGQLLAVLTTVVL